MTATESDVRDMRADGGEGTVHYAVHNPGETPDDGADARPRVRTRERSGESAQSQPDSAPSVDLHKDPAPITLSERLAELVRLLTPPDIWSQDRPSLRKVWAHAAHGDWTNKTGLPRRIGQLDALFIGVPLVAVLYLAAWTIERSSRRWAALILLVLLAQVPPLSWLT